MFETELANLENHFKNSPAKFPVEFLELTADQKQIVRSTKWYKKWEIIKAINNQNLQELEEALATLSDEEEAYEIIAERDVSTSLSILELPKLAIEFKIPDVFRLLMNVLPLQRRIEIINTTRDKENRTIFERRVGTQEQVITVGVAAFLKTLPQEDRLVALRMITTMYEKEGTRWLLVLKNPRSIILFFKLFTPTDTLKLLKDPQILTNVKTNADALREILTLLIPLYRADKAIDVNEVVTLDLIVRHYFPDAYTSLIESLNINQIVDQLMQIADTSPKDIPSEIALLCPQTQQVVKSREWYKTWGIHSLRHAIESSDCEEFKATLEALSSLPTEGRFQILATSYTSDISLFKAALQKGGDFISPLLEFSKETDITNVRDSNNRTVFENEDNTYNCHWFENILNASPIHKREKILSLTDRNQKPIFTEIGKILPFRIPTLLTLLDVKARYKVLKEQKEILARASAVTDFFLLHEILKLLLPLLPAHENRALLDTIDKLFYEADQGKDPFDQLYFLINHYFPECKESDFFHLLTIYRIDKVLRLHSKNNTEKLFSALNDFPPEWQLFIRSRSWFIKWSQKQKSEEKQQESKSPESEPVRVGTSSLFSSRSEAAPSQSHPAVSSAPALSF